MLAGGPASASCVQGFDDSLNSAIHITYRISLRSSSLREPRYPLLKVVSSFSLSFCVQRREISYVGTHVTVKHRLFTFKALRFRYGCL
jgi:hypothetical protein